MPVWVFILAAVLAVILYFIFQPIRGKAARRAKIRAHFGQLPQIRQGLSNAENFYAALVKHSPCSTAVDDLTWHDLSMDDVFDTINACQSSAGDVRLYSVLRRPVPQPGAQGSPLAGREDLIALLEDKPSLRLEAQLLLSGLGRLDGNNLDVTIYRPETLALERRWLCRVLAFLPLLTPLLCIISLPLGGISTFVAVMANANYYSLAKNKQDVGFSAVRYLAAALHCAGKLATLFAKDRPEFSARLRAAAQNMGRLRRSIALLSLSNYFEESAGFDPMGIFLLPLLSYGKLAQRLAGRGPEIEELYRLLGEVDLAAALLSYRACLPEFSRPAFHNDDCVAFTDIRHPLLFGAVPNTARFEQDILFTGSNASGKSTFIKSIALNCILAQTIHTCTAGSFSLRPGCVATSMAVADSVVDGDSYFVAELKSMRRIVRLAKSESFAYLFIDEILKGTNTVERIAASSAVLGQLAEEDCLSFTATHDIELTTILQGLYQNYHFRETVTEDSVFFDYRLHQGPATTRNAILLLQRMQFPSAITTGARQLVSCFEEKGEWGQYTPEEPPA